MPATQTIDVFDGLEFNVEPVESPDPVYYTSDEPEFNNPVLSKSYRRLPR